MVQAGADIRVVQEMLGHTSYAFTSDTYVSVLPRQSRIAADSFIGSVRASRGLAGAEPGQDAGCGVGDGQRRLPAWRTTWPASETLAGFGASGSTICSGHPESVQPPGDGHDDEADDAECSAPGEGQE